MTSEQVAEVELDPSGNEQQAPVQFASDLTGIAPLSREQIELILDTAEHFREVSQRPIKKVPALRGKTVVNLFFEPSTRTRTSFEIAGKRLSADVQSVSASTSSVVKGETLLDTARNIEAMAPDILVMRHRSAGAADFLAKHCSAAVVNAGDGAHEHPTQALLDALTMRQAKGDFAGLRVAIIGDIAHSRVARSNILPARADALGVEVQRDMNSALVGADVVMMLRVQVERGGNLNLPSTQEYFKLFGLTEERLALANEDAVVMHPGPMNRGVEIASSVADGPRSLILEQVTNGLAVRMAVLYLLAGGSGRNDESAA